MEKSKNKKIADFLINNGVIIVMFVLVIPSVRAGASVDYNSLKTEYNETVDQKDSEISTLKQDKKALKESGLAEGGSLFKKLKVNATNIDKNLFKKIDIRETTSFQIPGSSAEILSQVPAGSYKLTKGNNATTLTITDPTRFWSVSRFLIIKY